jgi:putative ABC transport system permease protein
MRVVLGLAWRSLRTRAARLGLAAAGVALGVALVVAVRIINDSTLGSFRGAITDLAGGAALQVRGRGPFGEELVDRLNAVPGVERAVPVLTDTVFALDGPTAGDALALFATDLADGHAVRTLRLVEGKVRVVGDPIAFIADPRSVVLSEPFAKRAGIEPGAKVRLRSRAGVETFTLRGLAPAGGIGRAFGGDLALMDVAGAQRVLGREGLVDQVDVVLQGDASVDAVERAVAAVLPPGLEVLRPARRGEQIERYLAGFQTLLEGLSGLALLAAAFLVASAVATEVAARRREIGLLRCAGARRRDVAALFLAESAAMGLAGALAGIPLGLVLARVLRASFAESTELVLSLNVFGAALEVTPGALALGAASGVVVAGIAGWLPGRAAVGVPPLAALGRGPSAAIGQGRAVVGIGALAAAVTAAALWLATRHAVPTSGNVAALAADVACVCAVMWLASRLAPALVAPVRAAVGGAARIALHRLAAMPDQLALATGVLALALGLVILAGTLVRSFEESVLDFIRRQVRADLVVASTATTGWIEAPVDARLGTALAAVPGVARVERLRLAEHEHDGERISIDSLDEPAFAPGREGDFVFTAGDPTAALAAVRAGRGALVSQNFARRTGIRVGDVLHLDAPAGRLDVAVAGAIVDYVSPRGSVILARPVYERWWHDTAVNRFHLWLEPGARPDEVRRAITRDLAVREGLKVLTLRELYDYHREAVRRAFALTRALEILPLLVAGLGLAQALLAAGLDRRREFALLRAAGATRSQVARSVVLEGVAVGTVGLLGALAVGVVLSTLWSQVNFPLQLGWEIALHPAPGSFAVAAVAALLVSVPASLLPARRAGREPVSTALREE